MNIRDVTNHEWVSLRERYEKAQRELALVNSDILGFANTLATLPIFMVEDSAYQFKYDDYMSQYRPEFVGFVARDKVNFWDIKEAARQA